MKSEVERVRGRHHDWMAIEIKVLCSFAHKVCSNNYTHAEDYFMLLVAWAYREIQCLSELCRNKDQYLASLFNHCMERNLKHSSCSMNIWLNKQCTWKMLETWVPVKSQRDRSLEVHAVLWE